MSSARLVFRRTGLPTASALPSTSAEDTSRSLTLSRSARLSVVRLRPTACAFLSPVLSSLPNTDAPPLSQALPRTTLPIWTLVGGLVCSSLGRCLLADLFLPQIHLAGARHPRQGSSHSLPLFFSQSLIISPFADGREPAVDRHSRMNVSPTLLPSQHRNLPPSIPRTGASLPCLTP